MTVKIKLKKLLGRRMMVFKDVIHLELDENQLTVTNKGYIQTYGRNLFSKVIILEKR